MKPDTEIEAKEPDATTEEKGRRPSFCSGLAARWTDAQIEEADSEVNDISEEIDNRRTRKQLRQIITILADRLYDAHSARQQQLSQVGLLAFKFITEENQNTPDELPTGRGGHG